MKTRQARFGRFPEVLWDEVRAALDATTDLLGDRRMELLRRLRMNRITAIAAGGLNADFSGAADGIPHEHFHAIAALDVAFAKMHEFRGPGGARRYLADSVASEARSALASDQPNRRGKTFDRDEIEHLLREFLTLKRWSNVPHGKFHLASDYVRNHWQPEKRKEFEKSPDATRGDFPVPGDSTIRAVLNVAFKKSSN